MSLLDDDDLTSTELVALVAISMHESPSNDTLARVCRFKTDGPDRGHNAVRFILRGLKARGYIRVEAIDQTPENPTGRVIHLLPKAGGKAVTP